MTSCSPRVTLVSKRELSVHNRSDDLCLIGEDSLCLHSCMLEFKCVSESSGCEIAGEMFWMSSIETRANFHNEFICVLAKSEDDDFNR